MKGFRSRCLNPKKNWQLLIAFNFLYWIECTCRCEFSNFGEVNRFPFWLGSQLLSLVVKGFHGVFRGRRVFRKHHLACFVDDFIVYILLCKVLNILLTRSSILLMTICPLPQTRPIRHSTNLISFQNFVHWNYALYSLNSLGHKEIRNMSFWFWKIGDVCNLEYEQNRSVCEWNETLSIMFSTAETSLYLCSLVNDCNTKSFNNLLYQTIFKRIFHHYSYH